MGTLHHNIFSFYIAAFGIACAFTNVAITLKNPRPSGIMWILMALSITTGLGAAASIVYMYFNG